ncbi:hypothetical protein CHS0354_039395 [Potamilus streckersoni]|uniref:Uncharacterized protein n=1 Tax=Potamilus streckersoni TaxID=2493646 RepID=A0AAE0S1Q2_9BIVA|nr:hypothetical protein CHS0354_039395 [Potamilus streckersoni]
MTSSLKKLDAKCPMRHFTSWPAMIYLTYPNGSPPVFRSPVPTNRGFLQPENCSVIIEKGYSCVHRVRRAFVSLQPWAIPKDICTGAGRHL